jgi:hypothetical protein
VNLSRLRDLPAGLVRLDRPSTEPQPLPAPPVAALLDRVAELTTALAARTESPDDTNGTCVPVETHPEARCNRCGGPNVTWCAPSPLWNEVMRGGDINGPWQYDEIICPTCFAVLAEEAGVASRWRLCAERVTRPLQLVTPSGRTWNAQAWLWDEPAATADESRLCSDEAGHHYPHHWRHPDDLDVLIECPGVLERPAATVETPVYLSPFGESVPFPHASHRCQQPACAEERAYWAVLGIRNRADLRAKQSAATVETPAPLESQCGTCRSTGWVKQEAQIGAPGSGCTHGCPDCAVGQDRLARRELREDDDDISIGTCQGCGSYGRPGDMCVRNGEECGEYL